MIPLTVFDPPLFLLLLFLTALAGSLFGTWVMCRLGSRYGWLAQPREDRWHKRPTVLHGGVGFFIPFIIAALGVVNRYGGFEPKGSGSFLPFPPEISLFIALLGGAGFMFGTGLWDDVKPLRPATKLLGQLVAVSFFVYLGGVFPLTRYPALNLLFTYFWFVGIINAVNMLDNMDGLAAGVVAISVAVIVFLAREAGLALGKPVLAVPLGLALVAALLGFLYFNRPPARIFMGDSGSLSLGYVLAALAVPGPLNGLTGMSFKGSLIGPAMVLIIPVTVVAIPIFDTTLVTVTRLWRAQKPSEGGRDHTSHRLVGLGLSEAKAVAVLYALSGIGGVLAVLMVKFPGQSLPLFGFFVLVLVLSGVYLGHVKVKKKVEGQLPPSWTPLVADLLYKRHTAELLLDTFLSILCFYAAHLLRFEGILYAYIEKAMLQALPVVVPCSLLSLFVAGIYRGQWRFLSVQDIPAYALGVVGGTVSSLAVITLFTRFNLGFSRSAYIIYGILFFISLMGSRLSFRLFDVLSLRQAGTVKKGNRKAVLIYGAGKGGKLLFDEVLFNPKMSGYAVVGFIDDAPNKMGRNLCGLPIKSPRQWAREWRGELPEIWISSRSIRDEAVFDTISGWDLQPLVKRLHIRLETVAQDPSREVSGDE